jgi:lysozyme
MIKGVDISDYQAVSSFHEAQASGIGFVICKATQGTGNVQTTFADYTKDARSIGLVVGAYHFMEWGVDPAAQAAHFLSVYTPQNGDLPPTLDCEAFGATSKDDATAAIQAWLDAVTPRLGGAKPMIYASYSAFGANFDPSGFSGHPAWVAAYNSDGFASNVPPGLSKVVLWQYTDAAQVPGIGNVDGDEFNGDEAALKALCLSGLEPAGERKVYSDAD